jgi:hypothetical protein
MMRVAGSHTSDIPVKPLAYANVLTLCAAVKQKTDSIAKPRKHCLGRGLRPMSGGLGQEATEGHRPSGSIGFQIVPPGTFENSPGFSKPGDTTPRASEKSPIGATESRRSRNQMALAGAPRTEEPGISNRRPRTGGNEGNGERQFHLGLRVLGLLCFLRCLMFRLVFCPVGPQLRSPAAKNLVIATKP